MTEHRPIHLIANEIRADWPRPNYAAVPYLQAMSSLDSIHGRYGMDLAEDVIRRFLINAGTWRGPVARRIKSELKGMLPKR